jgi:phosphoenolpyruvate carboxykinase (GTP)
LNTPRFASLALQKWVDSCIALTEPETVHVCDGSEREYAALLADMVADGTLTALNQATHPHCYLHRSDPGDVARVEDSTFICSLSEGDAGPTNNWWDPVKAHARLDELFRGAMRGRTLYIVPYLLGPPGSPVSRVGVEITDSPYVVASMRLMTRMGTVAIDQLGTGEDFVSGLHARGDLDPAKRYICHFPEERAIASFGSNYGGNALLGKKCFALRIASALARDEGWMAEHMLILELENPKGELTYIAAAFPSASGKTNLAMLVVPPALAAQGWKVRTVGDDIAWMHVGADGRLWAVNPEAGFFGVVPGTSAETNSAALATIQQDTIFTNVAVTDTGEPYWEGKGDDPGEYLTDWRGERRRVADGGAPFAHPNSRFTVAAAHCPTISPNWQDPAGVPISAILFGGRRDTTAPLVLQAFDWQHGVFLGATMGSRTTAAASGATNVLRRDPMAMLPFCGYHMGDYFAHWLAMGAELGDHAPAIFQVNWFRRDSNGAYLWPGYGENIRPLIWIHDRIEGEGYADRTAAGWIPTLAGLHMEGLRATPERVYNAARVDATEWRNDAAEIEAHFTRFGDRLPAALRDQLAALRARLG